MNSADIAPMVIALALIFTTGGVIVLRPISKRLGDLIELLLQERRRPPEAPAIARLADVLDRIDSRLDSLEERQAFAEALFTADARAALSATDNTPAVTTPADPN